MRPGPAISQDHFAAVLAMLNQQQRPGTSSNTPPSTSTQSIIPPASQTTPPSQPNTPQSGPIFNRNDFQNIMQQIMMNQSQPQIQTTSQPSTSQSSGSQPQSSQSSNAVSGQVSSEMAGKLEQMHEFGFFDDALNMRALEITEGNVEAAISLIIEGGDMI